MAHWRSCTDAPMCHSRALLSSPSPSPPSCRAFGVSSQLQIACGHHLPAPIEENGKQLGWPQTWVKLGYGPRKALADQRDQAADSAL